MNVNDPISDFLTRIRNACMAGHSSVEIPYSKMKNELARILKQEGFIRDFVTEGALPNQMLKLYLKYDLDEVPVIRGLRRISRPGLRAYTHAAKVPRVLGGIGIAILSTSHGVLTDREARKQNTGGEILCEVW